MLQSFADRYRGDQTEFLDAGKWEYDYLRAYIAGPKIKVFVFKNSNASQPGSEFFHYQNGDQPWQKFPIRSPKSKDEVYDYQPMMRTEVLDSALNEVKRLAPPETHRYLLVAKSHGNAQMAMTAFLARDISTLSDAQICKALLDHQKAIQNKSLGKNTADPLSKDTADPLGKEGSGPLGIPSAMDYLGSLASGKQGLDAAPSQSPLPGISKVDFGNILAKHKDMYFPIVVMEACKSEGLFNAKMQTGKPSKAVPNVSFLYTSDAGGLNYYDNINYAALESGVRHGWDIQDVLKDILDKWGHWPKEIP